MKQTGKRPRIRRDVVRILSILRPADLRDVKGANAWVCTKLETGCVSSSTACEAA
jgi:hypothetical protein